MWPIQPAEEKVLFLTFLAHFLLETFPRDGNDIFFSSPTFLLGVMLQSRLRVALLGISLFPFQPRPLRR